MQEGTLYNILRHAHSGLRWVVLILLVYAIFNAWNKKKNNKAYTPGDRKLNMFAMVSAHTQLLIGLVLYFISPLVQVAMMDMSVAMKNSLLRHVLIEHSIGMLVALTIITIGHAKSKRLSDSRAKHGKIFTFYLIGLLIILVSIPWPFRGWGNGWF